MGARFAFGGAKGKALTTGGTERHGGNPGGRGGASLAHGDDEKVSWCLCNCGPIRPGRRTAEGGCPHTAADCRKGRGRNGAPRRGF